MIDFTKLITQEAFLKKYPHITTQALRLHLFSRDRFRTHDCVVFDVSNTSKKKIMIIEMKMLEKVEDYQALLKSQREFHMPGYTAKAVRLMKYASSCAWLVGRDGNVVGA